MRHTARHITRCQTPPGRLWGEPALWKSQRRRQSARGAGQGHWEGKDRMLLCRAARRRDARVQQQQGHYRLPRCSHSSARREAQRQDLFFFLSPAWNRGTDLVCEGRLVCARHEKVAAAGSNAENPRDSARHVSGSAPYHCARRARARSDDGSPCQDVAPCLPRLGRASSWFVQARAGSCLAAG